MSEPMFLLERRGPVAVLTLNRPARRNAITLAMMDEIAAAVRGLDAEPEVRALVLTGNAQCFSAGMDLHEAQAMRTPEELERGAATWQRLNGALESSQLPVIAAIEGPCMTGGLELALACDLRVAGEGATFGITSARIGTVPGAGATQRLPRLVGAGAALELLFTADAIDSAQALRIGLVNRVTESGGALEAALVLASRIAERAPLSLASLKRAVRDGLQLDLAAGLALESRLGAALCASSDREEGLRAFHEKRPARFTGR
jgi:enoyl-CoA hydratase/carnithine racemase